MFDISIKGRLSRFSIQYLIIEELLLAVIQETKNKHELYLNKATLYFMT